MTFLKWNGGKTNILSDLDELFPNMNIKGYIEPFLGAGSVFFHVMENYRTSLENKPIYLSDINTELINCYKVIRNDVEKLINQLDDVNNNHNVEYYHQIRKSYNIYKPGNLSQIDRAAYFIYLNKVCFNGQMRVNSEGVFNMGLGHPEKIEIYDRQNLRNISSILQHPNIKLNAMSFENIVKINNGDLKDWYTYLDPPYHNDQNTKTDNFVGYTRDKFDISQKMLLRNVFNQLHQKGAKVMMSNSNSQTIEKEYKDYNIYTIKARRSVSANAEYRGKVDEFVITNYQPIKKQKDILEAWC